MRKLATVEKVGEIEPIANADAIVLANVRGWQVVTKIGGFAPGDLCIYFEVDALLPEADERFAFLMPRGVRTDATGIRGHVLKTARLRGVYSQGLALSVTAFPEAEGLPAGSDVTELLGIVKYEPPVPADLSGATLGARPSWTPLTDAERVQNVGALLNLAGLEWIATEKIDGTSVTFTYDPADEVGIFGASGRNWRHAPPESPESGAKNAFWRVADDLDLPGRLAGAAAKLGAVRVAVQGEIFGNGVQANPLKVTGVRFAAFAVIADFGKGAVFLPRSDWPGELTELSVPVLKLPFPRSVAEALERAETLKSALNPLALAEGIVWRTADTIDHRHIELPDEAGWVEGCFKALSRKYLLKHGDA